MIRQTRTVDIGANQPAGVGGGPTLTLAVIVSEIVDLPATISRASQLKALEILLARRCREQVFVA